MRTFSKDIWPNARTLVLALLCASLSACGKKDSADSSGAAEELLPTVSAGGQPGGSGDQPGGGIGTVILPDDLGPAPSPAPSPMPQAQKRIYYASGFLGVSFADNEAVPDGHQGWSHSYAQATVGSNPSLTTDYRMKAE